MTASIRSILFVHSGALGDTVLHLRVAEVLRHAFGHVAIGWLGRDSWLPVVRRCECIDRLAGIDAMRAHRLFEPGERTDADLADWLGSFDLILNSLAPASSPAAARLERLARRGCVTYDTPPRDGLDSHITDQWIGRIARQLPDMPELAEALVQISQQSLENPEVLLRAWPADRAEAEALLRFAGIEDAGGKRLVLVHPGSGGRHKCWPLENYVRLVELLPRQGARAVLVAGPAEMERLGDKIEPFRKDRHLIADSSLSGLFGLGGLAGAYVGNDSGPTHLAAAMGVPTLTLFGPTDPRIWRPIGPRVMTVRSWDSQGGWADLRPEDIARTCATMAS